MQLADIEQITSLGGGRSSDIRGNNIKSYLWMSFRHRTKHVSNVTKARIFSDCSRIKQFKRSKMNEKNNNDEKMIQMATISLKQSKSVKMKNANSV